MILFDNYSILISVGAVFLLLRIAIRDLATQKISNNDLSALALIGLGNSIYIFQQSNMVISIWFSLAVGFAIFFTLFPFWIFGKIGAGDVKLLSIIPLIITQDYLLLFCFVFLSFVAANVYILKGTILDGIKEIQGYIDFFGGRGIIPFGVPISAAAITVIIMRILSFPSPIG